MGIRDAFRLTHRRLVVAASPWKYRRGTELLPFARLVSPLRYDVLVRLEYFRFHERNLALFERDFPAYLEDARGQPYFVWFREVLCRRRHPELPDDPAGLLRAFESRVRAAAELHRDFRDNGFDTRSPIVLRSGTRLLATSTGKRPACDLFAGDGCHRMALLMLDGQESLSPEYYRIRNYPEYAPLDNTHLLIGPLRIGPPEYYRYLSMAYSETVFQDREALLTDVREHDPGRLAELERVLEIDERMLIR
jgi:hypothetical protein